MYLMLYNHVTKIFSFPIKRKFPVTAEMLPAGVEVAKFGGSGKKSKLVYSENTVNCVNYHHNHR